MAFYHLAFITCATLAGHSTYCESEKLVDTQYFGLVSCYTYAKKFEKEWITGFNQAAKAQGDTTAKLEVKTRCLTTDEGDEFLKKNGPSALFITGKKFE